MKRYKPLFENISPAEALKIFGIESVPDKNELNKLYKDLSKKHHPDLGGDVEEMKKVNQAYDVLKSMKASPAKFKSWDEIHKEWKERNEAQYPIMKKMFEDSFNKEAVLKYLQQFTSEELFIDIETNEGKIRKDVWEGAFLNFIAEAKIHNKDNTLVFYVKYWIGYNIPKSGGLGYDAMDEKDILYTVNTEVDIWYNNRKQKLSKRTYQWNRGHKIIADYEEVFPKAKLKKIFSGGGKKAFKKADFYLGLQRELPKISAQDNFIFIYPLGKDSKTYISIWRSVFMKIASYGTHSFHAINPDTKKYYYPALRLQTITIYENEESLRNLIGAMKEIAEKSKNLDEREDSKKIYEITKDAIEKYFPKDKRL